MNKEKIRKKAYFFWEAAGKPEGHDDYFWFLAERFQQSEDHAMESLRLHMKDIIDSKSSDDIFMTIKEN